MLLSWGTELPSLRKHRAYVSRLGKEAGVLPVPTRDPTLPDTRVENPAVDVSPGSRLPSRCPLEQRHPPPPPVPTKQCLSCSSGKMNAKVLSSKSLVCKQWLTRRSLKTQRCGMSKATFLPPSQFCYQPGKFLYQVFWLL